MPDSTLLPALPRPALFRGYGGAELPLPEYAALVAVFGTLLTALLAKAEGGGGRLGVRDLVLLGVATHKLSRLIAKDKVIAPFRAPFAKFIKSDGAGEVEEEARGAGLQKAVGDLVTCPFCVSPWAALALASGLVLAPRAGRLLCGILSAIGGAHFLHHAYVALENRKEPE